MNIFLLFFFTPYSAGQLYVYWEDSNMFSIESAQIHIFKKTYQVGLSVFVQSHHG